MGCAVRNGVGRAVLGRDLHLIADRLNIDGRSAAVGKGQSLQVQHHLALRLCRFVHVDGKLSAGAFAADRNLTGCRNGDICAGDGQIGRIGDYAAGGVGCRHAAAAVDQGSDNAVIIREFAAAGQFLDIGELGQRTGHGKCAVVRTAVVHLRAAGIEGIAVCAGELCAACQHIGVLLIRRHFKDSIAALLQSHSVALFPLCRIVQLYHALGAAGSVYSHCRTGRIHAECVVGGCRQHIAAGNGECAVFIQGKATVAAGDHRAAGDIEGSCRLYCVIAYLDAHLAREDGNVFLGGFQTVCGRGNGNRCAVYLQGIVCPDGIGVGSVVHIGIAHDSAAVELDVVLGTDSRIHTAGDVQRAGTVLGNSNITVAVDHTAGIGVCLGGSIGQRIFTGAGQFQFLCALSQNAGRTGGRGHGHILQIQGNCVRIRCGIRDVHQNLSVCDRAVYGVVAGGRDGDSLSGNGGHTLGVALYGNTAVAEVDGDGVAYGNDRSHLPQPGQIQTIHSAVTGDIGVGVLFCGEGSAAQK